MLDGNLSPLNINISFSVFYRVFPSFKQQIKGIKGQINEKNYSMERVWKRKDYTISNLSINPINSNLVELDLSDLIKEIKKDENVHKRIIIISY